MESPKWEHDCEECKFLGRHTDHNNKEMDLYWCPSNTPELSSVIGRWGSNGPEYYSQLPPEAVSCPEDFIAVMKSRSKSYYYIEAMVRATERGLYTGRFTDQFKRALSALSAPSAALSRGARRRRHRRTTSAARRGSARRRQHGGVARVVGIAPMARWSLPGGNQERVRFPPTILVQLGTLSKEEFFHGKIRLHLPS